MFYLISGKILSVFVFLLVYKLFKTFPDLILFENVMGWFVVDHILEEYNFTSGKFFLINEDFRSLIRNLVVLIVSVFFFSQQISLLEFLFINTCLVLIVLVLINKKLKYKAKVLIFTGYIYLCYIFLSIDFAYVFYLFNSILVLWFLYSSINVYFYLINMFLTVKCSVSNFKQSLIILSLKFSLYTCLFVFTLVIFSNLFFLSCDKLNNFVLEVMFKILIPYTYIFYF